MHLSRPLQAAHSAAGASTLARSGAVRRPLAGFCGGGAAAPPGCPVVVGSHGRIHVDNMATHDTRAWRKWHLSSRLQFPSSIPNPQSIKPTPPYPTIRMRTTVHPFFPASTVACFFLTLARLHLCSALHRGTAAPVSSCCLLCIFTHFLNHEHPFPPSRSPPCGTLLACTYPPWPASVLLCTAKKPGRFSPRVWWRVLYAFPNGWLCFQQPLLCNHARRGTSVRQGGGNQAPAPCALHAAAMPCTRGRSLVTGRCTSGHDRTRQRRV
jgi:hypothetical protein